VKDIRRAMRKEYSAEEKIRILLDGLRGSTASRCWRACIILEDFLEGRQAASCVRHGASGDGQ
jgi:hypothetical protein